MSDIEKKIQSLREEFPLEYEREKEVAGGTTITFVPWYFYAARLNDLVEDGIIQWWESKITSVTVAGDNLLIVVSVNVDGMSRAGTGSAEASKTAWGGAHSEAFSQAFRRACAAHGLGLYMYWGDEDGPRTRNVSDTGINTSGSIVRVGSGNDSGDVIEGPTDRQKKRLSQLGTTEVFTTVELDAWRDRLRDDNRAAVAGQIIREMKEAWKDRTGEEFTPPEEE